MTEIAQLEDQIKQTREEMAPTRASLDLMIKKVAAEMEPAARRWMDSEMRRAIDANAARISSGKLDLAPVKAEFKELLQKLPDLCQQAISGEYEWPHVVIMDGLAPGRIARGGDYFELAFRDVVSNLGALLGRHQLVNFNDSQSGWRHDSKGPRYSFHIGFDDQAPPSLPQYHQLKSELSRSAAALKKLEEALQVAKARAMWNDK